MRYALSHTIANVLHPPAIRVCCHLVRVSYYSLRTASDPVRWLSTRNKHYSGDAGLCKLTVPSILARAGIQQVILLDTDILLLSSLTHIWSLLSQFRDAQCLALVHNHTPWYLAKGSWPALVFLFHPLELSFVNYLRFAVVLPWSCELA